MTAFSHLDELERIQIWPGLTAREVSGSQAMLTYIELDANTAVPEHQHRHEQTGILLHGSVTFTIGGETQELRPGAMWVIPGETPHNVAVGPEGAVIAELFAPARDDWGGHERLPAAPVTLP
jgi:quercetin dioxygenase-like cupin family protein